VVQVSALAVGLLALVLLVLLRTDLISSWRQRHAARRAQPLRHQRHARPGRGFSQGTGRCGRGQVRLVPHDPRPADRREWPPSRPRTLPTTARAGWWTASSTSRTRPQRPQHNEIVAGRWTDNEAGAISVEEGIAETLNLHLGDTLRFDIGGVQTESKITSLRKVDWGSMRANFFVIYPVAKMDDVPITYMSAFRAPAQRGFDNTLVRAFPNITNVDMTATLTQVQGVLDKVIRAIEFLFGFTLAAGLVVLFAAVTATREERAREFAIMRAVGARASLLRQVQRAELVGVGLLAGFLASGVASVVGWGLARYAFDFAWTASPLGAAGRRAGGRRAGTGRGLVGPARGAAPPGGGHAAARGRMNGAVHASGVPANLL
jgi:putative ABC transport system permease protein